MDREALRILIRDRLRSGRLPYNRPAELFGGPACDEICAACGTIIRDWRLVMEGVSGKEAAICFHLVCFELWNKERLVWDTERRRPEDVTLRMLVARLRGLFSWGARD